MTSIILTFWSLLVVVCIFISFVLTGAALAFMSE